MGEEVRKLKCHGVTVDGKKLVCGDDVQLIIVQEMSKLYAIIEELEQKIKQSTPNSKLIEFINWADSDFSDVQAIIDDLKRLVGVNNG